MEAIEFGQSNVKYAENQPEYLTLPAHKAEDGDVTMCWKLSFRERVRVVFSGRIFLQLLTFNRPLQPLNLSVCNPLEISNSPDTSDL